MRRKTSLSVSLIALALGALAPAEASADEYKTYASHFGIPEFDRIDENGVDLTTGTWRVRTPVVTIGAGEDAMMRGLEWTGQAWSQLGLPALWRDDEKYTVVFNGRGHEFELKSSGFKKLAPDDGSTFECEGYGGYSIAWCTFRGRDGDIVIFQGFSPYNTWFGPDYGFSALQFGNSGIQYVLVSEGRRGAKEPWRSTQDGTWYGGNESFGYNNYYGTPTFDTKYNTVEKKMDAGSAYMSVTTPNNNADDEHYQRPKDTTQTVKDQFGNSWSYQVNNDRELIKVTQPGGAASVSATYYDNHKVKTITTPAGTWNYSYTTPGDYGTTTVTNPQGETTYVKYHRKRGYVTESRDALDRMTYYTWNGTTRRLDRVTYPDNSYDSFTYDARGNVLVRTHAGPGGVDPVTWQAQYAASCTSANRANCNQPNYIIDPRGNRTDFTYTGNSPGPTTVVQPAPAAGQPRPTTINEYGTEGELLTVRQCMTLATCAGTADEIVTQMKYYKQGHYGGLIEGTSTSDMANTFSGGAMLMYEKAVTADGQTLRSCMQYSYQGWLVSETPPAAGVAACPQGYAVVFSRTGNAPEAGPGRSAPVFATDPNTTSPDPDPGPINPCEPFAEDLKGTTKLAPLCP
ncbi:hypothetical protein K3172_03200 [Qipengyuania sp. 6B39]|uniref:hypothetical protein n=1 Tax=Qipengyuania proteolytica TaxID=2867239 RepID=UPI001C88E9BA|nr:hypothetical protein [Qipengyuania proteolytica]MBX7494862.1 hypothetical protein [Qipengyuania proteolytica]